MESNSSLPMCTKSYNKLIVISLAFSTIVSFPQLVRCETDMVATYRIIPYLQHCYDWVVKSNSVHNY